jgi:hypothetical protein
VAIDRRDQLALDGWRIVVTGALREKGKWDREQRAA